MLAGLRSLFESSGTPTPPTPTPPEVHETSGWWPYLGSIRAKKPKRPKRVPDYTLDDDAFLEYWLLNIDEEDES